MPFRDGAFGGTLFVLLIHLVRDWVGTVRELGRVTRGPVAAVTTIHEPDLRGIYLEARTAAGHPTGWFDRDVVGLAELIPPQETIEVSSIRKEVDAKKLILDYEPPAVAPSGVHAAALERIITQYGSPFIAQSETVKIITWPAEAFAKFSSRESSLTR